MKSKLPFFVGYASLQSNMTLEEVGLILSEKIFAGLKFSGKELEIHEEVPAIFIQEPVMGLKIILDGFSGLEQDKYFTLSIGPWISFNEAESITIRLDNYLRELLKVSLKDVNDVVVMVDYENSGGDVEM
jgi:hypothetical protein